MTAFSLWSVSISSDFASNINFFCVIGQNRNEVLVIMKDDKVFALGSNSCGCVGLGHNSAVKEPEIVNELCDQQIIDISYGYSHILALTKSLKCFSWGYNANGKLGNSSQINDNIPKVIRSLDLKNIVKISCGGHHSLVLTKSGGLYGFGYNANGEIGCGNNTNQLKPIKINGFNNEYIISIACGANHSLALTDMRQVYSWGLNIDGQLGLGNKIFQNIPVKMNLNNNQIIESIFCGLNHSILVSEDERVYTFGLKKFRKNYK